MRPGLFAQALNMRSRCIPDHRASQRIGEVKQNKKSGNRGETPRHMAKNPYIMVFSLFPEFWTAPQIRCPSRKTERLLAPQPPKNTPPLGQCITLLLARRTGRAALARRSKSHSWQGTRASHSPRSTCHPPCDRSAAGRASVRTKNLCRPPDELAVQMQACRFGHAAQSLGWECRH